MYLPLLGAVLARGALALAREEVQTSVEVPPQALRALGVPPLLASASGFHVQPPSHLSGFTRARAPVSRGAPDRIAAVLRDPNSDTVPAVAREDDEAPDHVEATSRGGAPSGAVVSAEPVNGAQSPSELGKQLGLKVGRKLAIDAAYEKCRKITQIASKTFYAGSQLFEPEKQRAVWAVYAWARRLDDIVDKPRADGGFSLRQELAEWSERTENIWKGIAYDQFDLALVDTVQKYPELTIKPFEEMIKGMVMDLDKNRYENFDDLYLYCYRVAGTVGEMMLPIMGTAPGYTIEDARPPAIALGIALQLTNILRDVGEDRMRKRIYLPQEDLRQYGVTEADLFKGKLSKNYVDMTKFEIDRARDWYDKSAEGIKMLAPDAQLPIRAAADMYASILNKIEANDYDNFDKRAYTTKLEKLMLLPGSFAKVKANGNGNGP